MNNKEDLNFELDDLRELKTDDDMAKEFLENSPIRCKLFLWFCKVDGNKKKITTKEVKGFFKNDIKSIHQIRLYLNELTDCKLLMKSRIDKKTYRYFLNKNNMYFEKFIPIAKDILGLK